MGQEIIISIIIVNRQAFTRRYRWVYAYPIGMAHFDAHIFTDYSVHGKTEKSIASVKSHTAPSLYRIKVGIDTRMILVVWRDIL